VVSAGFVSSLIEILFSGSSSRPFMRTDVALTKVETRAADFAINSLADSLADAFSKIVEVSFAYDGARNSIDWTPLGRKGSIIVVCKCRFKSHGQGADAFFLIPRAALDPFREILGRDPNSKGMTKNSAWTSKLHDQVVQTSVTISAVMERSDFTLDDVARLEVGQVIALPVSPEGVIPLKCGERRLFGCTLGQKDGYYTVRIEEFVNERQDFLENVLGLPGA
jgi:flagellar motor switch protein FliM